MQGTIKVIGIGTFGIKTLDNVKKIDSTIDYVSYDSDKLHELSQNIDSIESLENVILLCGLSGKSSSILRELIDYLRSKSIIVTAIVTLPFKMEGDKRKNLASIVLDSLMTEVEELYVLDNVELSNKFGHLKIADTFGLYERDAVDVINSKIKDSKSAETSLRIIRKVVTVINKKTIKLNSYQSRSKLNLVINEINSNPIAAYDPKWLSSKCIQRSNLFAH